MKNPLLFTLTALALAGCGHNPPDNRAEINALSQRVEAVIERQQIMFTNEMSIFNEVTALKSNMAALATTKQIDSMSFYYHTNLCDVLAARFDKIEAIERAGGEIQRLDGQMYDLIFTNIVRAEGDIEFTREQIQGSIKQLDLSIQKLNLDETSDMKMLKIKFGISY